MIGRLSVVSRPTSSSKKSARWVSWYGTISCPVPGNLAADLAGADEDLAGHEVHGGVRHDLAERRAAVHQIVLVRAVAVALAVAVVLVGDELLAPAEQVLRGVHRLDDDQLARPVIAHRRASIEALGRRHLGMGMIDVVPSPVGENRVDEVGLDLGRPRADGRESPSVECGAFVLEVPRHPLGGRPASRRLTASEVRVDQQRRRGDWIRVVDAAVNDAVLGLETDDLGACHLVLQRLG